MKKPLVCPKPGDLERLARGALPHLEAELLGWHVIECTICADFLDSLQASDTLAADFQAAARQQLHDPIAEALIVRLVSHGQGPEVGTEELPRIPGYEVLDVLGRGGMGVVYRARHAALQRMVALKMILAGAHARPEELVRFKREAEAAARLQHPNIVQIHEIGEHQGRPFLSLEYICGGTLAQKLAGKPQPARTAARLVEQLARAIHWAHVQGIIHRDLKPANILLSTNSTAPAKNQEKLDASTLHFDTSCWPKITDFGLAKQLDAESNATRTGDVMGTPAYMAPEQAAGKNEHIGPATDVYALGAILYEMLTGRPPFRAETPLKIVLQVLADEPVSLRRLEPTVPRDLETICLKCLAKEPGRRYASAELLAEDLRRYLAAEPIQARRIGVAGRLIRYCRRQPAMAATIAVATVVVLLVAAIGIYRVVEERDRYLAERDRYLGERNRAESEKNEAERQRNRAMGGEAKALVGEARALIQARDTGWWWKAMDNLQAASRLGARHMDPALLREQAIDCFGSSYPCMRLHRECSGHTAPVRSVAISPDDRLAASGSLDATVRLWGVPSGQLLAVLKGHTSGVTQVAFQPRAQMLASCSQDGSLRFWQLAPLLAKTEARAEAVPTGAAESVPKLTATRVMDMVHVGGATSIAFSPDGALLGVACGDGKIRLFRTAEEKAPQLVQHAVLPGSGKPVTCLAYSPNGKWLASAATDLAIRIWDADTGIPVAVWPIGSPVMSLAWSPSSDNLAWSTSEWFNSYMKSLLRPDVPDSFGLHAGPVTQVLFDGRDRFFSASLDGTVKNWQRHGDRRELAVAGGEFGAVYSAAIAGDGRWLMAGYADGQVRLWECAEPPQRALVSNNYQCAEFIGRERLLVCPAGVYDFAIGLGAPFVRYGPPAVHALAVCPGTHHVAVGTGDGGLVVWDWKSPKQIAKLEGHGGPIRALASNAQGTQLASAADDGNVKIWDWNSGQLLRTLDPQVGNVHALTWTCEGQVLAVSGSRGVILWDLPGDARPRKISNHPGNGLAAAQGLLALCGANNTVELWDATTASKVHILVGHGDWVMALEFSPDGKQLASAGRDGTIRIWDPATGKQLVSLQSIEPAYPAWLAWQPKGHYLVCGVVVGRAGIIWDLRSNREVARLMRGNDCCGQFAPDGSTLLLGKNEGGMGACKVEEIEAALPKGGPTPAKSTSVDPVTEIMPGGHSMGAWGIAASPDGKFFATASHDRNVKLWDARTRQLLRTFSQHQDVVWCVAFSPGAEYVASGGGDGVRVWDTATGRQIHHFKEHSRMVSGLAFHPKLPWLFSGAYDGKVRLADWRTGKQLGLLHQFKYGVRSLAIRHDGWLAAACDEEGAAVWDFTKERALPAAPDRWLTGHKTAVWAVGFSADCRYAATGSGEGVIVLWDGKTFDRVVTLKAGVGQLRSLSFSYDGALLAGGTYGRPTTIVWDLPALRSKLKEMNLDW
jgi:eukaryotic-like serine/threonine-protein kinase